MSQDEQPSVDSVLPNQAESPQPGGSDEVVPKLEKPAKGGGCISPLSALVLLCSVLVLAAILVPNFVRANARGKLTACKSNLKNIGTALEMYSTDWSGKYPTTTSLLTPNYLKTIPECPAAGSNSYVAVFGSTAVMNSRGYEDYYFIECHGENHKTVSVTGNYPAYNGVQGLIERRPDPGGYLP
jgi:type II secretory pathway pseudopilin PulG